MPARSRPTARLLTPSGWMGLVAFGVVAAALIAAFVLFVPRLA